MIQNHINTMIELVITLKEDILCDIEDVRKANHEKLLDRNDEKIALMQSIGDAQQKLNQYLMEEIQNGGDIDRFRGGVDLLEMHLRELYELNGKLASIVLPVREMYRQIIEDIATHNGGMLFEVRA